MATEAPQARSQIHREPRQGIAFKVALACCRNAKDRRHLVQEICARL